MGGSDSGGFDTTVFLQALGLVYATAFCSIYSQVQGLFGVYILVQDMMQLLTHMCRDGLEPVASFMANIEKEVGSDHALHRFAQVPSLVWFHGTVGLTPDLMMECLCLIGMILGALATAKLLVAPEVFGTMWISYLSIVFMGGSFLRHQWDSLLLEVGFLAIWIAPPFGITSATEPPQAILWALRFVFVKFNFMSAVAKILSGCPTWLGLTALDFHFATQEMPNMFSWYAHQLSPSIHSVSAAAALFIQGPLSLLGLSPISAHRIVAFYPNVLLHLFSLFTGNYGFSNVLAIALAYALLPAPSDLPLPDRFSALHLPAAIAGFLALAGATYSMFDIVYENNEPMGLRFSWTVGETKQWLRYAVPTVVYGALGLTAFAALVQNLRLLYAACIDLMNFRVRGAFASSHCFFFTLIGLLVFGGLAQPLAKLHEPTAESLPDVMKVSGVLASRLRLAAAYGNFQKSTGVRKVMVPGTFTNEFAIVARPEIILEGSADDGKTWHAYEFNYKPGNVHAPPQFLAPHHSRVEWHLATAAKGNYTDHPWLVNLVIKLLHGSPTTLQLMNLDKTPFSEGPPKSIRAQLYHYDFTRWNTTWARDLPNTEILYANTPSPNGTAWWTRSLVHEYLPPVDLKNPSLIKFAQDYGWPDSKVPAESSLVVCASSSQPMLCEGLVYLHSIYYIRGYMIAAFALFLMAKLRMDAWTAAAAADEAATEKQKTD
ncbi:Aste57867_12859 [Aphanomyces stellatus]|uniref:Lipase maturation factor 2 n=1 Tax=Aphanomyces stellatus TaxID=120398 RepID=A0A485KWN1_9STRA|nr:hypothetical protein As57867_012811 [Aphanomyces stellatus]VFT89706.1 Aste57867_12859 [Aphanomyces stellatus]